MVHKNWKQLVLFFLFLLQRWKENLFKMISESWKLHDPSAVFLKTGQVWWTGSQCGDLRLEGYDPLYWCHWGLEQQRSEPADQDKHCYSHKCMEQLLWITLTQQALKIHAWVRNAAQISDFTDWSWAQVFNRSSFAPNTTTLVLS